MEKIKNFFTNKEKKLSRFNVLGHGISGIGWLIIGIYLSIFTVKFGKIDNIKAPWDTILFVGIMVLGMVLIGCGVVMILDANIKWQEYKMQNGFYNHHLQFKDIKHLLPEMRGYLKNCEIEESRVVTTNGLTNNLIE